MTDPTSKLEMAAFEKMYGTGAKEMLWQKLQTLLPESPCLEPSLSSLARKMEALKDIAVYSFAKDEARIVTNIAIGYVKALSLGDAPNFQHAPSMVDSEVVDVKGRLPYLVSHTESAASATTPTVLTGQKALAAKLEIFVEQQTGGASLILADLRIFDAFDWLLTSEQKKIHSQLVDSVFKKASMADAKTLKQNGKAQEKPEEANIKKRMSSTVDLFKRQTKKQVNYM